MWRQFEDLVPQEALIGITYAVTAALGFLLIELLPRVITVFAALLLLNEVLDWTAIVGLIVMPVAIWIGRYKPVPLKNSSNTPGRHP